MLHSNKTKSHRLLRRGFDLGLALQNKAILNTSDEWQSGRPILLKAACLEELARHQGDITQAAQLHQAVLDEQSCDDLLDRPLYLERLKDNFESLGSSINEGDDQEIETTLFDAIHDNNLIAEDLWMKVSWLSFYEEDASLRFRFSFGVDLHEDVAADAQRQHYAALLCDAIFPESALITQNKTLVSSLNTLLKCKEVHFVERIVYFNSPQGGAYLHHDRERGHAGVVYAQITGSTFWLALTRSALVNEIITFVNECQTTSWPKMLNSDMQTKLAELASNPEELTAELESFSNDTLIHLINETELFVQQLINHGHSKTLKPGDILVLPQETEDLCCWHSVFTLGETSGEALSFAIRRD